MKFKKMIAMLLCVGMTLGIAQVKTAASEVTATDEKLEAAADTGFSEVVELREENVKHFDLGNGQYQAIAYGHPVHELDAEGKWQDIDFGLTLTNVRGTGKYVSPSSGASFAASYSADQPLMTLSNKNNNAVSMTLVDTSAASTTRQEAKAPIAAKVTTPNNNFRTAESANQATFSSRLLYEEVLPGVDLEYIVDPGTVKENIIVNKKADRYEYVFSLKLTGLYPSMNADGSIVLYDLESDARQYEIPAPFMYDALGNVSHAVSYTLNGSGNAYTLTVTADAQWINASGRAFPVTVDPSYVATTTSAEDTFIYREDYSLNYGSSSELWVSADCITYIKTPRPVIPSGMKLGWAAITAFYYYHDHVTSGSVNVSAHRMLNNWNEYTVTFNQADSFSGYYGLDTTALTSNAAYGNVGATVNNPENIDFVITDLARGWANLEYANYGIGLKYAAGSTNASVVFKSYESSYNYRPRLTYRYGTNVYEVTSCYDLTMNSTNLQNIPAAIDFLDNAYFNQFGIDFSPKGSPLYRGYLTDTCRNGPNQPCTESCDTPHHKDVAAIAHELSEEFGLLDGTLSNNKRVVFWTDRLRGTYCEHAIIENDGSSMLYHYLVDPGLLPVVAWVRPNTPYFVHIMNLQPDNGTAAQDLTCMSLVLAHEMAHTFGLNDRYEEYDHNDEGFQCVMEKYISIDQHAENFYNNIKNGVANAFCSDCASDLREILPN